MLNTAMMPMPTLSSLPGRRRRIQSSTKGQNKNRKTMQPMLSTATVAGNYFSQRNAT